MNQHAEAPQRFNFDFLGKRHIFFAISMLAVIASFWIWFEKGDTKWGTDFKGGSEFLVRVAEEGVTVNKLRDSLQKGGVAGARVQSFEGGSDYTVQVGVGEDPKAVRSSVEGALKQAFGDKAQIIRIDYVGPTVGKELQRQALLATVLSLLAIMIYVSWRFEFAFALGVVVAIFHDIVVTMGVYLFCGKDITMGTLAAVLTIVGYVVNDTIVIFDRVREEIFKSSDDANLVTLMNRSINFTLSRNIITSVLTIFSVAALLIFGGGAISDLSLYLFIGMILSCYSTIYIASPLVLVWDNYRQKRLKRRTPTASTNAAA